MCPDRVTRAWKVPHALSPSVSAAVQTCMYCSCSIFTRARAAVQGEQPTCSRAQDFQLVSWWGCTGIPVRRGFHHTDVGRCNMPGHAFPSDAVSWNESSDGFETTEPNQERYPPRFSQRLASALLELPVWWWTERAKQIHCLQVLPFKGTFVPIPSCPHWKPGTWVGKVTADIQCSLPVSTAPCFLPFWMCLIIIVCFSEQAFQTGCHPMLVFSLVLLWVATALPEDIFCRDS